MKKGNGDNQVICGLYVDDLLFVVHEKNVNEEVLKIKKL